jgi:hypothetical protein
MRTTVGRFWGYVSVLVALGVSLAGNVTAAYLHAPALPQLPVPFVNAEAVAQADPTWVDIGIAGLPPLAAFLLIELANHNPWADTKWGPRVVSVLLWVVAPASAVVSFIHLVSVVMHGKNADITTWEGRLNWITAILTALLIDGLMFGGTAALLLPKSPATKPPKTVPVAAVGAYPDWRDEMARLLGDFKAPERLVVDHEPPPPPPRVPMSKPPVEPRKPKVKATLAPQKASTEKKRYAAREHPVWPEYEECRKAGIEMNPNDLTILVKAKMGKEITIPAAQTMLGRWKKEYEKV